jgi:hypothetical protein
MKRIIFLSIAVMLYAGMMAHAIPQYEMDIFARFDTGMTEMFITRGEEIRVDSTFSNLGDPVSARLFLDIFNPEGNLIRTRQVVKPFTVDRPVMSMPQLTMSTNVLMLGVYSLVFRAEAADQPGIPIAEPCTLYIDVQAASSAFIGFMGYASVEDLDIARNLGANDVAWGSSVHPSHIESLVDDVSSHDLRMATRAPGRASMQDSVSHELDMTSILAHLEGTFLGNDLAGITSFHYMIDEFCHPDKWVISSQDLADLWSMAKSIDPRINIFHNAGHLGCFQNRMDESAPVYPVMADYVGFTVTPHKLADSDYLELMDSIAGNIREIYGTQTKVIAMYAVCDQPGRWSMVTPAELVDGASQVIAMENIDGIGFYPWGAPSWSTTAIRDVCEEPDYIEAFNLVFDLARERFGNGE